MAPGPGLQRKRFVEAADANSPQAHAPLSALQVSHDFPGVPLAKLGFKVGPIELGGSITLESSVYAKADMELDVGMDAIKSANNGGSNLKDALRVGINGSAKLGAQYDSGSGWSTIHPPSNTLRVEGRTPHFTFDAALTVGLKVAPKINLLNVLTVTPTVDLYAKATADMGASSCDDGGSYSPYYGGGTSGSCPVDATLSLDSGFNASVGGKFGFDHDGIDIGVINFGPWDFGPLTLYTRKWGRSNGAWQSTQGNRRRRRLSSGPSQLDDQTEEQHRRLCGVHGMPIFSSGRQEGGCLCFDGWTGSLCDIEEVAAANKCPEQCSTLSGESLGICAGRVAPTVCTDPSQVDARLAQVKAYSNVTVAMGNTISDAMLSLLCSNAFPSCTEDGDTLPICWSDCTQLLASCGVDELTADVMCSQSSVSEYSPVSTPTQQMQGQCQELIRHAPHAVTQGESAHSLAVTNLKAKDGSALFTVNGDQEMHARPTWLSPHASCVVAPDKLAFCKHREGLEVVLRSDQFKDVDEADHWASNEADQLEALLPSTAGCKRAATSLACLMSVPLCDSDGLWHRMRFSECKVLASSCPQLFDGDPDATPAHVCTNSSSIVVRGYVAAPEHECAVRPEEAASLKSYNVPHDETSDNGGGSSHNGIGLVVVVGAVAAVAGIALGAV